MPKKTLARSAEKAIQKTRTLAAFFDRRMQKE